ASGSSSPKPAAPASAAPRSSGCSSSSSPERSAGSALLSLQGGTLFTCCGLWPAAFPSCILHGMTLSFDQPRVLEICRAVHAAGGRAYLVGGLVRDRLMGSTEPARDYDLEVYGLDGPALRSILERF